MVVVVQRQQVDIEASYIESVVQSAGDGEVEVIVLQRLVWYVEGKLNEQIKVMCEICE